jgi:hypothetical protein
VVAVATALALIEAYPYLDIQKDDSLSATNPYRTMLVARNGGWIPISSVVVDCKADTNGARFDLSDADTKLPVHGTFWHDGKFTLGCERSIEQLEIPGGNNFIVLPRGSQFESAELRVSIHYSFLIFGQRTQLFHLTGQRADDGTLHWSFSGE